MSDASEACRIAAAKSARPDVDAIVPAANDAPHTVRQAEKTHARRLDEGCIRNYFTTDAVSTAGDCTPHTTAVQPRSTVLTLLGRRAGGVPWETLFGGQYAARAMCCGTSGGAAGCLVPDLSFCW